MIQREINFQQVLQKCLKSDLSFTQPLNKHNMSGDDGLTNSFVWLTRCRQTNTMEYLTEGPQNVNSIHDKYVIFFK